MYRLPLEGIPPVLRERIGFLISRAHWACHEEANRAVELSGHFTIKHQGCLAVIDDEGPISQQSLSARIGIDRSTMVTLVDELEAAGLVSRTRNPSDRRAYALEATVPGRAWLAETKQALGEAESTIFEPLTPSERKELQRLLLKVVTGDD